MQEEKSIDPIGERLIKGRKLLICEEIDQTMAKKVIGQLLAMDAESHEDIHVFINSQGGHVEAGDSIHDMIQFVESKVIVIGTGYVASAGTHIFLAADKENRYCLPNTRFLIHQPTGGVGGQASDIAIQAEQILRMRERLARIISKATGQDIEQVRKDIERDRWMTTDEAIDYGILNKVVRTAGDIGPAE